ncbi:MAG: formylmethanofuran dehydrogenase subunit B [Candidatus Lokiarchaeota archaeon]|nr:formylmethanofuran dehydrogenase subunit B [Candidatus Lokiarchaeota archaeon]
MKRFTCSGCSLLCDDIIVKSDGLFVTEVIGACLKGKERFDQVSAKNRITNPMIRKDGELKQVSWDEAYKKAIEIIKNSSNPLLYGFSNVTCEAQEAGMKLAQEINGFIDSNASICQGKFLKKAKNLGINLTTITEIINKGDLIILWGANPAETIPRLLNKVLFSRGKFRMTGREIKTLVIIDPIKSASFRVMGVRDLPLIIEPNKDIDLIRILKEECCSANSIPSKGVAGLDQSDLKRLLLHLTGAENGVIILGQGVIQPHPDYDLVEELLELIQMINERQVKGRISLLLMGGHFNMAGFDHVALSGYGAFGKIEFKNNQVINTEDTIISKIKKDDFDSSIIVGTDPIAHLPQSLSSKMVKKPLILIDNHSTATSHIAEVVLPTSITGIESGGMAYRLDHVPIEFQKIINAPNNLPSDEKLLSKLYELLHQGGLK